MQTHCQPLQSLLLLSCVYFTTHWVRVCPNDWCLVDYTMTFYERKRNALLRQADD